MAESKKREFSRAIAQKRCLEAIDRAILINEGKAERPFLYTVNELVVFGSLVSSKKSKVHDVDLFVTWKQKLDFQDDYKAADKAWQDYTRKYAPDSLWNDWYKVQSFPQTDVMRYLRGRGSGLISLHGELDRIYGWRCKLHSYSGRQSTKSRSGCIDAQVRNRVRGEKCKLH